MNPYAPPTAPVDPAPGGSRVTPRRAAEIAKELRRLNRMSFTLGIPAFFIQVVANFMMGLSERLCILVGAGLFVGALFFNARLRGRHAAFCLLGLLSWIGVIVLYFMPKSCLNCGTNASFTKKQCERCGAPLGS